ncbi:MAG: amidohydrolase [Armatimonadota bacterium]
MKLDAHHHLWRYSAREYGWIGEGMEALRRDFLPEELAREQRALGFDGGIAVQARQTLEETEWLLGLAKGNDRIAGVVGWVDLCSAELPGQLGRFSGNRKLRGIRHVVQDERDDRFVAREEFVRGIAQLGKWKLAYDILIYPRHLGVACDLVRRFPEQVFVLDHMAKPPIKSGELEPWASGIRALAELPNVACKASGMVTEADWKRWRPSELRPYLDVVFEAFGAERVMIGSDWPVCTVAASYAEAMGVVIEYIREMSEAEQKLVVGENAMRWYGIGA